ncbi:hypothetical protein DET61_101216 [Marinobacter nauticus]|uniref:Uncharacterized protein n=1 Tax=Marinobacter nauticus TaxID=2743 RepID=A0A368Y4M0_MARNT|nr:hypothetical protein [Marinobacter nauticus]RCW75221.1 hypothetical protein DET61_101216 [Marinobacter nauticus]
MSDQDFFEYRFEARFDDKDCPVVVLEGPLPDRLKGLSLIHQDLNQVDAILGELGACESESVARQKGLLFGALVLYGKCYTEARGRKTRLKPESIFKHAPVKLRVRHDWLMRLRHEFVAHGGEAQEEQLKLLLVLRPEGEEKGIVSLMGHGATAHSLDIKLIEESQEAVRFAAKKVSAQIEALQRNLLKKFDNEGLEWAYQNAVKD